MNDFLIAGIAASILIIFLLREVVCWYNKTNELVKLQKETNRLLRKIAGEEPEAGKK